MKNILIKENGDILIKDDNIQTEMEIALHDLPAALSFDYCDLSNYVANWIAERKLTIKEAETVMVKLKEDLKDHVCSGFRSN